MTNLKTVNDKLDGIRKNKNIFAFFLITNKGVSIETNNNLFETVLYSQMKEHAIAYENKRQIELMQVYIPGEVVNAANKKVEKDKNNYMG